MAPASNSIPSPSINRQSSIDFNFGPLLAQFSVSRPLLPPPAGNMAPTGDDHYHPKDAIHEGFRGALVYGGVGLLFAAARNSLAKSNVGPFTTFTKNGGIIATFGMPPPTDCHTSVSVTLTRYNQLPLAAPTNSPVVPLRTCAKRTITGTTLSVVSLPVLPWALEVWAHTLFLPSHI